MAHYRKASPTNQQPLLGMLYIVEVRLIRRGDNTSIKQRLLMVGCESADIERKLRWVYSADEYSEFGITGVSKVTDKIHVLSTHIRQIATAPAPIIKRADGTYAVPQTPAARIPSDHKKYAIGLAAQLYARSDFHALEKVSHALLNEAAVLAHMPAGGYRLPPESMLIIEEVAAPSDLATARDVSNEINKAHLVRG